MIRELHTEKDLLAVARALLPRRVGLSARERAVLKRTAPVSSTLVADVRGAIARGEDPLGDALCEIRPPAHRRERGQTFTPAPIIADMVRRAQDQATASGPFSRIVDAGLGSARYLRVAARAFPAAQLVGVELDPVCALIARANMHVSGLDARFSLIVDDFLATSLPSPPGRTLFIGNPPYVRHHDIAARSKAWYTKSAVALGATEASKLAGLHLYFFVRTAQLAKPKDFGLYITAAEWLDTGYGSALRELLLGVLGGASVITIDAALEPFPGTMTTAAITAFEVGRPVTGIAFGHVAKTLSGLPTVKLTRVAASVLASTRWSESGRAMATRAAARPDHLRGRVGDLFRVSRGQVTGSNKIWIAGADAPALPARFLTPCVTGAEELFAVADRGDYRLVTADRLKHVITLPEDLQTLSRRERAAVDAFLAWAEARGARSSYTAQQRKAWWHVRLPAAPPILVTYMARRSPAFIRNVAGVTLLNVAHSVTPLLTLTAAQLDLACRLMNAAATMQAGRTYAGGLVKFEPRDVEALPVDWTPLGLRVPMPEVAA